MVTEYNRNTVLRRRMEAAQKAASPAVEENVEAKAVEKPAEAEAPSSEPVKKTDAEKLKTGKK